MKKTMIGLLLCTFLLGVNGIVNVHATQSSGTTTIGYTTEGLNMNISIKGEEQVIKGTSNHAYKAFYEEQPTSVVWSIKGATSPDTRIDEGGNLIVGVDETAEVIEILAYSTINPAKSASMKVKLIEKTYTIIDIEKKDDINVPYGTTEKQITDRLDQNNKFKVTIRTNDEKTYVIYIDQAIYYSIQDVVGDDGFLKEGKFQVIYDLIMPHISINYDDTIQLDYEKDSNIIGETTTSITVTVLGKTADDKKPVQKPNKPDKPIKGPVTGDDTNATAYLMGMGAMLSLMIFMYLKYKKDEEEQEGKE